MPNKALIFFALSCVAAACSSSSSPPLGTPDGGVADASAADANVADSTSTDGGSDGDLRSLCAHWYDARTDWFVRCGVPKRSDTRATALREKSVDYCVVLAQAPGNQSKGGLEACAKKYEASKQCSEEPCTTPPGSRAGDEPCRDDSQCKSLVCNREFGNTCGVCDNTVGQGQKCDELSCDPGLTCDDTNVCVPAVEGDVGEACGNSGCKWFLYCGKDKKCAQAPEGEGTACPGGFCFFGFNCGEDSKCHAFSYVGVGAACGVTKECEGGECGDDGKCVGPASDGAACGGTNGPCDVGSSCVSGKCAKENPSACN